MALAQRRDPRGVIAHRREHRQQRHERDACIAVGQRPDVGRLQVGVRQDAAGALDPLGLDVHPGQARLRHPALAQVCQPPARTTACVQDQAVSGERRPQRVGHLGAHRAVARVGRAPRLPLAGIGGVLGVDGRDARRLVILCAVRVVFLTHYFPPEVGAAQARIAALARGLQARGVEVTVHTGFPHYPSGTIAPPYRNGIARREDLDGLPVVRSLTYPVPNRGFARRLANHTVLAASTLLTAGRSGPADVVVAETPPLFTAASGALHALRKRAPLVLNVSDRWPESAVQLGALNQPQALAAAEWLERWCYARAAAVTAPTRGIVAAVDALPSGAGKARYVAPAVDTARWAAVPGVAPRADGPLRVLYAGTIGMAQGIPQMVQAARLAGPEVVELTIVGDGPERAETEAAAPPNVHVAGGVAPQEVPAFYADADVGLVPLKDRPIFAGALPTKLFEVMAAGRPCLLPAPAGEASRLLEETGAGLHLAPEDPEVLAGAFAALQRDPDRVVTMGQAARAAAHAFDRERAVDTWEALLSELAGRRTARAAAGRRPWG